MDLEFMILDTIDYIRPSVYYKKVDSLVDLQLSCEKIERFEAEAFQTGKTSDESTELGTCNLMNPQDARAYDDLIDGLSYLEEDDEGSGDIADSSCHDDDHVVPPGASASVPTKKKESKKPGKLAEIEEDESGESKSDGQPKA